MFLQAMHKFFCFIANLFLGMRNNPTMYVLLQGMV